MTIPEHIQIGGLRISVKFQDNLTSERDRFGEYSPKLQEIRIDSGILPDHKLTTFLHEVVEAIDSIFSLQIKHDHIQLLGVTLAQALTPMVENGN